MSTPYDEALSALEDHVARGITRAEEHMTRQEIAEELRRIADQVERGDWGNT